MTAQTLTTPGPDRRRGLLAGIAGVGVLAVILVLGLAWAKWLPYLDKADALAGTRSWSGSAIFDSAGAAGAAPSVAGAWSFTVDYFAAIWKALVVALLVAAALDALVPRRWLLAVLDRRRPVTQALTGGLVSLPSMMCTCCTAPVAVGLRRRGAPLTASLAYWLGNPVLNPAVLVFLALVLPWPYAATRLLVGAVLVLGVPVLVARLARPGGPTAAAAITPEDAEREPEDPDDVAGLRALPVRFLASLARFAVVLLPEYAVVVLAVGLVSATASDFGGVAARLGVLAVVAAAVVATLLVVPTGGEIPAIVAAVGAGAGTGVAGALLIALPALSLPSMVMVGRAMGWRVTTASAAAVALCAVVAGGVLTVL